MRKILLGLGWVLWLQGQTLQGFVKDQKDDEPLVYATVLIKGTQKGAYTNEEGYFSLNVPPNLDTIYLTIRYVGYEPLDTFFTHIPQQPITFYLKEQVVQLKEVVITAKDNYADYVMKMVLKHRKYNRMSRLEKFQALIYNKLVVTVDNVQERHFKNPLLRPAKSFFEAHKNDTLVFDETTNSYRFAIFLSETITRYCYKRPQEKEIILAKRNSGKQDAQTNLLSASLTNIDVYSNSIVLLGRPFAGFVNPMAKQYYYFYITEYEDVGNDTILHVRITPKSPYLPLFQGYIYVSQRDWAITKVDLHMNRDPNINFVEGFRIYQEFEKIEGEWLLRLSDVWLDFKNNEKHLGLIGRVTSYYLSYDLSPEFPKNFFEEHLIVEVGAGYRAESYWDSLRPVPLSQAELLGFALADSLRAQPLWDLYITIAEFLTTGKVQTPLVDFGPYSKVISFNAVEGFRFSIGAYSTYQFSKRFYLWGRLSYGLRDQRWKYQFSIQYRGLRKPYFKLRYAYYDEIEQIGIQDYLEVGTGALASAFRYRPLAEMNYFKEHRLETSAEIFKGLMHFSYLQWKRYEPVFPYFFIETTDTTSAYATFEIGTRLRIAFREKYYVREGEKISLGGKFPVFHVELARGFANSLGDYDYWKASVTMTDVTTAGQLGVISYTLTVGRIWGTLPLPSLYVFKGSQSYGFYSMELGGSIISSVITQKNVSLRYIQVPFNLLHFYEFVADAYVVGGIDHHLEGFFFNRIPLLRKLKWKELVALRVAWGTLTKANQEQNFSPQLNYRSPFPLPYVELGLGIENILKVLQVVYVRRVTYIKSERYPQAWNHSHGIRVGLRLSF